MGSDMLGIPVLSDLPAPLVGTPCLLSEQQLRKANAAGRERAEI